MRGAGGGVGAAAGETPPLVVRVLLKKRGLWAPWGGSERSFGHCFVHPKASSEFPGHPWSCWLALGWARSNRTFCC